MSRKPPLTQNKYIYAVNSPANFIDPTGEKFSFSKVASRAKSAVSKVRNAVKSVSGISKSKTSKGVSKAKSAANRAVATVKKAAKSLKGRINDTVKLSVSTRNNISKPSTYVNNNRQSGSRLVNSLNKAGGLKSSNNIVAKAAQLVSKTFKAVKNLSQTNKFVDRFSAGSKLANTLGSKLINSKNIRNIGFTSNVKTPAPVSRSTISSRKSSYGRARVEVKKKREVNKVDVKSLPLIACGDTAEINEMTRLNKSNIDRLNQ